MKTERKSETTARIPAITEDGRRVVVEQRSHFWRTQYVGGEWKDWQLMETSYWLNGQKLRVEPPLTLRDSSGHLVSLVDQGA